MRGSTHAELRYSSCMLPLLLWCLPVANPSSVLSREMPARPEAERLDTRSGWDFARPWQERRLRLLLGEAASPADRVLLQLGLMDDVSDHAMGGWRARLSLRLNGAAYLQQAVTSHIIRFVTLLSTLSRRLHLTLRVAQIE
jgi:hypothetical protein